MSRATLTRHEQQIAARYGSQMVCLVAGCSFDLAHIKSSVYGASDFWVDGEKFWMQTTGRGIELQHRLGDAPVHVLAWAAVTRHIAALPPTLRARAKRIDRLGHTTFPRPAWNPSTTADDGEALRAWASERWHRVGALRSAILRTAFPLAFSTDPVDLFDLITEAGAA